MNAVLSHPPYEISADAARFHSRLRVSDLHSDMLLWARDPLRRHDRGHTDIPRLAEGGVALQVFTAVTQSPDGQNYERNTAESDRIKLLAIVQRWPVATWSSIHERARYQAHRLHRAAERSDGQLRIALTRQDLADALAARETRSDIVVGVLGMEGAHPLEGDLAKLDALYAEGYRVIGLHHFFDNELGGSLHGISGGGLSDFGRAVVNRAGELGMVIDLSHSSPLVVEQVLERSSRPVILSHTGVKSHCDVTRNIPDALLARIAEGGGLIGIGFWEDVTCDDTPEGIARVILHAVERFGVEAVALGSDFDGTVTTRFDASELAVLTQALLDQGMSREDVRLVMGENSIRFFLENLPRQSADGEG